MLLSVCIPTVGEYSSLNTVESILKQNSDHEFEIILVGEINKNIIKNHSVKSIETGRIPPGKARNIAVEESIGDILIFTDSDCVASSDWLNSIVRRIKSGAELVGGSVIFPNSGYFSLADNVGSFFDQTPHMKAGYVDTIASVNLACTRNLFDHVGPFSADRLAGEDLEWVLKAKQKGYTPFLEPDAKVIHYNNRKDFFSLIAHAGSWGKESIKVRKEYSDQLYTPSLFFKPDLLSFLSPFIGAAFATKIILYPGMLKYFHTWPAIAISKTAWCLSASDALRNCDGKIA